MASLPEHIILSPTEQSEELSRPIDAPGHLPPQQYPEHFPFRLTLTGVADPLDGEHESTPSVISMPLGTADGNTIFAVHQYATSAEAVAVGNAFPYHHIYETLVDGWREKYVYDEELQRLPADARLALTAIYLYVPVSSIGEILSQPNTDPKRFEPHDDSPEFARYVFARGTSEQPLLAVSHEPSLMPCDLPPLDYDVFERMLQQYDAAMAGKHQTLSTESARRLLAECQMKEAHATATPQQMRLAHLLVMRLAKDLSGETASKSEVNVRTLEMLNQLFGDRYIDVGGVFSSDGDV